MKIGEPQWCQANARYARYARLLQESGSLESFMNISAYLTSMAMVFLGVVASSSALAQDASKPSLDGYSPVSYFTENKAERGSPEFAVVHDNNIYYLTSRAQVEIFRKNPDKYRPRHKVCTYSLALGKVRPLDPTNFKIVDGTLLLFHRSDDLDGLERWNKSELSEQEMLRRADSNIFRLRF